MIDQPFHLGISGVIEKNGQLLAVKKSRSPYKGLLDLPGGRPNHGEELLDALSRELQEETGVKTNHFSILGNCSFSVSYSEKKLYHIALIYRINDFEGTVNTSIIHEDVEGCIWIDPQSINPDHCSPLVKWVTLRVKAERKVTRPSQCH